MEGKEKTDCSGEVDGEKKKISHKSKVKCYNCKSLGIFQMSVNFPRGKIDNM